MLNAELNLEFSIYFSIQHSALSIAKMFVIELIYKVDLKKIDAHMGEHMRFLKKHYAAGTFLVSGRKIPRDGGMIIATGKSREEIEAIVREDPFCARGLADFRIIEFRASQVNNAELRMLNAE